MIISMRTLLSKYRLVCVLAFLSLAGCSGSSSSSDMGVTDIGSMSNNVGNFDDIELPVDMKWSSDESMVIRTDSFQGGILAYSGRVEAASLKQFIISSMENKSWKLVGEAQSEDTLLAFTKPNKTCMVVLDESFGGKFGYTRATYYVTVDIAAAGRLNPFGEPVN